MVFFFSKSVLWPVFRVFVKDIVGVENLPDSDFILASNHSSVIDGPLMIFLVAKFKNKKVRFFAVKDFFKNFFWNVLFNHFGVIRVNGGLKKALKEVKKGECIGIFPEGSRSYTGKVGRASHSGLGVLALKKKLPVVPVAVKTFNFWNRHRKFPSFKKNIKIRIGAPLHFFVESDKKIRCLVSKSPVKMSFREKVLEKGELRKKSLQVANVVMNKIKRLYEND